jgi:hypothetical protein
MELRLLSSADERQEFAHNLVETRISKGAGFSETRRSVIGEAHLVFGQLYALYDDKSANLGQMIGGLVLHDLGTFPQSYPRPDLTRFPPEAVLEFGELWARAAGSARIIRQAGFILSGLLKAQALLIYPIFKPWNLSPAYDHDFDRIGEPIEWPYALTLEGGKIYVQAMVSEGEKLERAVRVAGQWGFRATEDLTRITLNTPYNISARVRWRADRGQSVNTHLLTTSETA